MTSDGEYVVLRGARLWTTRQGDGPPLVFLHGGPGLWDYFEDLAATLDDISLIHRYDQRASGRSERVPPYDVATFVADLDALRLHWGYDRWIVAGHSWGASLALAYAVAHPEHVNAIVHIGGTGLIEDWRSEYHTTSEERRSPEQRARLVELRESLKRGGELSPEEDREYCVLTWQSDFADRSLAQDYARQFLREYPPSYDVNAALMADWRRLLSDGSFIDAVRRINVPVLVMHGVFDPRPPRLAERLAASLPKGRLAIIAKAGHSPWIEQPKATSQVLRGFLGSIAPVTARVP